MDDVAQLSIENVTVGFGGIMALSDVSFRIHDGELAAIIGPNGAGKTTLFNCICSLYTWEETSERYARLFQDIVAI